MLLRLTPKTEIPFDSLAGYQIQSGKLVEGSRFPPVRNRLRLRRSLRARSYLIIPFGVMVAVFCTAQFSLFLFLKEVVR